MKRSHFWWGIAASLGMGILILDSRTALNGAQQGIDLCIRTVIPSLFPFFVLSILLTNAFTGTRIPILRPLGNLYRIPGGCESILIPGFLGGYPAGAQCIGQSFRRGSLTRADAQRMLTFCNNAGPSFLFGILGPLFPRRWMVWALWGIQIFSALLYARMLPSTETQTGSVPDGDISLPDALSGAVRIMASVCGWVVVFRVVIAFLQRWFLWMLPVPLQVMVMGMLELSNGCCELLSVTDVRQRFLICSGLLSFGGLCVTMQTVSVIGKLSILPYLKAKLLQTSFSLIISAALLYRNYLILLILLPVFWLILKKTVEFSSPMMYNGNTNLRRKLYAVSKKNGTLLRLLSLWHPAGRRADPVHQERTAHP